MANILLAAKGVDIGKPNMEFIQSQGYGDQIEFGRKLLEKYNDRIGLPVDVALDKNGERVEESIDSLNKNRHSDLPILYRAGDYCEIFKRDQECGDSL